LTLFPTFLQGRREVLMAGVQPAEFSLTVPLSRLGRVDEVIE
jgi:hypothetical protein